MNVAAVACANGLGHVKRLVKVCNRVCDRAPDLRVSLLCEGWQVEQLAGWQELARFSERPGNQLVDVALPLRWSPQPGDYGGWLTGWHHALEGWALDSYDFVHSDNLIEPLAYASRVTLSGSFLWHDVLSTAFPDQPHVARYQAWATGLMQATHPVMLVNRDFAMPATAQQAHAVSVGLVSFYAGEGLAEARGMPERVLVALGSTRDAGELIGQVERALPLLEAGRMTLLASERWVGRLQPLYRRVEVYDFVANPLHTVDLAIIRAGLGTIADCVAARVPVLTVEDTNPEIAFNQARLAELGVGMPLADAVAGGADSPLASPAAYAAMRARFEPLALSGEEEAADFLLAHWGAA